MKPLKTNLDIYGITKSTYWDIVQGDINAYPCEFTILADSKPYDMSEGVWTATITWVRANQTTVTTGADKITIVGNVLKYTLESNIYAIAGALVGSVELYKDGGRITTCQFTATVRAQLSDGTEIPSQNEYNVLLDLLTQVTASATATEQAKTNAESAVGQLNTMKGTLQGWLDNPVQFKGDKGSSAYEIALANGFTGTESEWLASLDGTDGVDGASAYEVWLEQGNTGTEADFITSLKGEPGEVTKAEFDAHKTDYATYAGTIISVLKFGAKGDGVTNDTVAVQNALNSGKIIYFPDGTYLVSSLVTGTCPAIYGNGGKSILKSNGDAALLTISNDNFNIDRLCFEGANNAAYTNEKGITMNNLIYARMTNLTFKNFLGHSAVYITGNVGYRDTLLMSDCYFLLNKVGFYSGVRGEYCTLSNCHFSRNTVGAIITGGNCHLDGCQLNDNVDGVQIVGATGQNDGHGLITNCQINHCTGYGLKVGAIHNGFTISNCHIYQSSISIDGATGYPVRIIGSVLDPTIFTINNCQLAYFSGNYIASAYLGVNNPIITGSMIRGIGNMCEKTAWETMFNRNLSIDPLEDIGKLYELGEEFIPLTGGWKAGYSNGGVASQSKEIDHMLIISPDGTCRTYMTSNPIDFSDINTISVDWELTGVSGVRGYLYVTSAINGFDTQVAQIAHVGTPFARKIETLDVSALTGSYYVSFFAFTVTADITTLKTYKIWLE